MFDEKVVIPQQLPIQERNRKSTDVCCTVIGAIFALTMFIVACCMWNPGSFNSNFSTSWRTNGAGEACKDGEVVYSSDPYDFSKSTCRSGCPSKYIAYRGTCVPEDENERNKYLENPSFSNTATHEGFKTALWWSSLVALGFGLLWMTLVWCAPKHAPLIAHAGAIVLLIALGILILVLWDNFWSHNNGLRIFIAIFCFILAIILLAMLCWWATERKFQGLFLDYAKRFLSERPDTFLYIPVFMLFTIGLVALISWQHACFSSRFATNNNFWNFNNTGFWEVMNILEFIWGLQFLRDAFNFCVSGAAADWYWMRPQKTGCYNPYQRFLCKHWGSVVGGSFLNAFFELPTLLIELFVCHPQTCCSKLGTVCYNTCSCCTCFFDLVRTDAYSYINITGIPFCNAARQCKKINERCPAFIGSHSPMKHFRFAAHVFCVAAVFLMTWFILRKRVWFSNFWHYAILIVVIYMIVTWFIDIHADAAEGIQTSFLVERQLENGNFSHMQRVLPSFRAPLEHIERRIHGEGDGFC